jgi:hypothetical protein
MSAPRSRIRRKLVGLDRLADFLVADGGIGGRGLPALKAAFCASRQASCARGSTV